MKAYVVVEGHTDIKLITGLLPEEIQQHTAVVVAGKRSSLVSVARTLLVTRRKPLAIFADADTVDESSVLSLRRQREELLQAVSGGVPFKVLLVVPEVEALLFAVPEAIERIAGQQLSADNLALAKYNPCQVLVQLGKNKQVFIEQFADTLTDEELNRIRETSPLKELIEFLSENVVSIRQPQSA